MESLAERRSSTFDDIYWIFLDGKYFGPLDSLEDRFLS